MLWKVSCESRPAEGTAHAKALKHEAQLKTKVQKVARGEVEKRAGRGPLRALEAVGSLGFMLSPLGNYHQRVVSRKMK